MKKLLFFAAFAVLFTASCSKNDASGITPSAPEFPIEGAAVQLSFVASPSETRAFGDGTTEAWEKQINNATVLVFSGDAAAGLKYRRELSAVEIATITTTPIELVLPSTVGAGYLFALVANRGVPTTVLTYADLCNLKENDWASYNGLFGEVTTKAMRSNGFVMFGSKSETIAPGRTNIAISLARSMAKVEVFSATTAEFNTKYTPATITVDHVELSSLATEIPLSVASKDKSTFLGVNTFTQQTVGGNNLFYLFRNDFGNSGTEDLRTKVKIAATYDADGNPATTIDQSPVEYAAILNEANGGLISSNQAYRLNIKINGLIGSDVSMTVAVANWDTLITQEVEVGN